MIVVFVCDIDVFFVVSFSAHRLDDRHCCCLYQLHFRNILCHFLHLTANQLQQLYRLNGLLLPECNQIDVRLDQSQLSHKRTIHFHFDIQHLSEMLYHSI